MELRASGIWVSKPRVARAMKRANMKSIIRRKYRVQTRDSDHIYPVSENFLQQNFTAERLAQKWVSDLIYIKTGEGGGCTWLQLWIWQTVKLLAGHLAKRWKLGIRPLRLLKWLLATRAILQPLLFHSNRGVQYACGEFRLELKKWPIQQSMSRKGNCWDNAVAESFFKTMKTEMVYHRDFKTKAEAK